MNFERLILANLIHNEEYTRKVIPFLKPEYFSDTTEKIVYQTIHEFIIKYNARPTIDALIIELDNASINENIHKTAIDILSVIESKPENQEWLLDKTEKFCQDKAIYNGIMTSINIMDDKSGKTSTGAIPQILSDALSVCFDSHIGHDFMDDSESRYDFYHKREERIPFDLEFLNKITVGGLPRKTLNLIMAPTGVGKTLAMCHFATSNFSAGLNVLYITLEMSEERIAERIDANLMDIPLLDLKAMSKESYDNRISRIKTKSPGRLIIKEFPTASASVINFKHLLSELKLKKKFIPDIIYIDYINICTSSRIKPGNGVNTNTYIKNIAEEMRGLAVEYNVPIVSATQVNRGGMKSSDIDIDDTAESIGITHTVDFMIVMIRTEEMIELNQILWKQLKNRYSDVDTNSRFVTGVDKSRMKLYDVEQAAQDDLMGDRPVMDSTKFITEDMERSKPKSKSKNKSKFGDFK